MSPGIVCRLCLSTDAPVRGIAGTPLQDVYEKLTEISLITPHRPVAACYLCYCQLRKCHKLMVRSVRADKVFARILRSGEVDEQEFFDTMKQYQLGNGLCVTPMELIAFTGTEHSWIKDEMDEDHCHQSANEKWGPPEEYLRNF